MQAIGQIMSSQNQTPTQSSGRLSCDGDGITVPFGETDGTAVTDALENAIITDESSPLATCPVCGRNTEIHAVMLGWRRRLPVACECVEKARIERQEQEAAAELQTKLMKFKAYSLMDADFERSTFENWQDKGDNGKLLKFGKAYCEHWETVKAKNRGAIILGPPGTGKTYLSFAIANELYKRGVTVIAITLSGVYRLIQRGYQNDSEAGKYAEQEILRALSSVDLLILDDVGTEENKTPWAYTKLYAVIDGRYRAKKPLIITTNLSFDDLQAHMTVIDTKTGKTDGNSRIYDRLIENCTSIMANGESWRKLRAKDVKNQFFKELGLEG